MKTLLDKIMDAQLDFEKEATKHEIGNKAAGRRARKISLELVGLYKQFRKESV